MLHDRSAAPDAQITALAAITFVIGDERLAGRFLDLTGLTPAELRQSVGERHIHLAVLDFLAANETDLIACAEATGTAPETMMQAREQLVGEERGDAW